MDPPYAILNRITAYLRANGAGLAATTMERIQNLGDVAPYFTMLFVPIDAAFQRLADRVGIPIDDILGDAKFDYVLNGHFSVQPVQPQFPMFMGLNGRPYGRTLKDISDLNVKSSTQIGKTTVSTVDAFIVDPELIGILKTIPRKPTQPTLSPFTVVTPAAAISATQREASPRATLLAQKLATTNLVANESLSPLRQPSILNKPASPDGIVLMSLPRGTVSTLPATTALSPLQINPTIDQPQSGSLSSRRSLPASLVSASMSADSSLSSQGSLSGSYHSMTRLQSDLPGLSLGPSASTTILAGMASNRVLPNITETDVRRLIGKEDLNMHVSGRTLTATRRLIRDVAQNFPGLSVVRTIDNGDCYYDAISRSATEVLGYPVSIQDVRKLVSNTINNPAYAGTPAVQKAKRSLGSAKNIEEYQKFVHEDYAMARANGRIPIWGNTQVDGQLLMDLWNVNIREISEGFIDEGLRMPDLAFPDNRIYGDVIHRSASIGSRVPVGTLIIANIPDHYFAMTGQTTPATKAIVSSQIETDPASD